MTSSNEPRQRPISCQHLVRILIVIIVGLAFLAGFYHSSYKAEQQKSAYLESQLQEK